MEENRKKKSDVVAKILGIILGVILVLGVSYALFTITIQGTKRNRIVTGTLDLKLVDTDEDNPSKYTHIELDNTVPMSIEEGFKTTPYVFTLQNVGNIDASYKISLEVDAASTLPANTIRYSFSRTDSILEPTSYLLSSAEVTEGKSMKDEDVILYTLDDGIINIGESFDYKLYLWVDYDADNSAMSKEMNALIRVDGVQKNK